MGYFVQTVHLGPVPGRYIAAGLYSGVAVKRGSTVYNYMSTVDTGRRRVNKKKW